MMTNFIDLAAGILAVNGIVEIWRHGSIFAGWRARVSLWGQLPDPKENPPKWKPGRSYRRIFLLRKKYFINKARLRFLRWLSELLGCGFCLSVWVGWLVAIILLTKISFLVWWVYGIALARGANWLNDLFYNYGRTPKNFFDPQPSQGDSYERIESDG